MFKADANRNRKFPGEEKAGQKSIIIVRNMRAVQTSIALRRRASTSRRIMAAHGSHCFKSSILET